ncbi:MAG TPA: hypothetical protein VJS67_04185 [Pseudonocardiaceae bacterium]|nr:hypothetical protein [Pseudonocardiaceae bacterium]
MTCPIRGADKAADNSADGGIATVLAAVRSATDTIGGSRPECRCVEPSVTGGVDLGP